MAELNHSEQTQAVFQNETETGNFNPWSGILMNLPANVSPRTQNDREIHNSHA